MLDLARVGRLRVAIEERPRRLAGIVTGLGEGLSHETIVGAVLRAMIAHPVLPRDRRRANMSIDGSECPLGGPATDIASPPNGLGLIPSIPRTKIAITFGDTTDERVCQCRRRVTRSAALIGRADEHFDRPDSQRKENVTRLQIRDAFLPTLPVWLAASRALRLRVRI